MDTHFVGVEMKCIFKHFSPHNGISKQYPDNHEGTAIKSQASRRSLPSPSWDTQVL